MNFYIYKNIIIKLPLQIISLMIKRIFLHKYQMFQIITIAIKKKSRTIACWLKEFFHEQRIFLKFFKFLSIFRKKGRKKKKNSIERPFFFFSDPRIIFDRHDPRETSIGSKLELLGEGGREKRRGRGELIAYPGKQHPLERDVPLPGMLHLPR